jgi:hypothetical protein
VRHLQSLKSRGLIGHRVWLEMRRRKRRQIALFGQNAK